MSLFGTPTFLVTLVMEAAVDTVWQLSDMGVIPEEIDPVLLVVQIRKSGMIKRAVEETLKYAEQQDVALLQPDERPVQ